MYVCLCNGVTDSMIEDELAKGNDSFNKLVDTLSVTTVCGGCTSCVSEIIKNFKLTNGQ